MVASLAILLLFVPLPALGLPSFELRNQQGVRIIAPPRVNNTDKIQIPELDHPFVAPGPYDLRGPCPGLNTLANHGYLPRNGVASFEQIVRATGHAFNMNYDLASGLAAFAMLARGNTLINQLSIGLESPLVPPLPGQIDGPAARGLASHGRFEGDVSMTRQDAALGDNRNFQPSLFAELLNITAHLGDDSDMTGPKSIVNIAVMQEFKYRRFLESQAANKKLEYHAGRFIASYAEAAFTLNFFADGKDGTLSVPAMTSFFRDQRFPEGYHRRAEVGYLNKIIYDAIEILTPHPILPGANDESGVYAVDAETFDACAVYNDLASNNVPAVLLDTTGPLKENVDFLLNVMHNLFPDCPAAVPSGAANV